MPRSTQGSICRTAARAASAAPAGRACSAGTCPIPAAGRSASLSPRRPTGSSCCARRTRAAIVLRRDLRRAGARGGAHQAPALPHRAHGAAVARRAGHLPAAAGGRAVRLSAGTIPRHHAARRTAAQLLDRLAAARFAPARAARAARAGRRAHRSAVRRRTRAAGCSASRVRWGISCIGTPSTCLGCGCSDAAVGGGTGLAPLKSMLAARARERLGREMTPVLGGAQRARSLRARLARGMGGTARPTFATTPVLSEPAPLWAGRARLVHDAVLADMRRSRPRHEVYASGPPAMIEAVRREFAPRGVAPDAAVLRFLRLRARLARAPADEGCHEILILGRIGLDQGRACRPRAAQCRGDPRAGNHPVRPLEMLPAAPAVASRRRLPPVSTLVAVITWISPAREARAPDRRAQRRPARRARADTPRRAVDLRAAPRKLLLQQLAAAAALDDQHACARAVLRVCGWRSRLSESKPAGRQHRDPIAGLIERARGGGADGGERRGRAAARAARAPNRTALALVKTMRSKSSTRPSRAARARALGQPA